MPNSKTETISKTKARNAAIAAKSAALPKISKRVGQWHRNRDVTHRA